jgi:hypothetical protein
MPVKNSRKVFKVDLVRTPVLAQLAVPNLRRCSIPAALERHHCLEKARVFSSVLAATQHHAHVQSKSSRLTWRHEHTMRRIKHMDAIQNNAARGLIAALKLETTKPNTIQCFILELNRFKSRVDDHIMTS